MNITPRFLRVAGFLATICSTVLVGSEANATDRYVPSGYSNIQLAMNAANPGDHIIVEPGVYSDLCIIYKPDITIRAEIPGWSVLDSTGIASALVLSEVEAGAGPLPVLEGFEIRGGNALAPVWTGNHQGDPGLGLTIRNCWFHDNDAGAVNALDSILNIEDCHFESNKGGSGGIVEANNAEVNITNTHFYGSIGSGAGAVALRNSTFTIDSCIFQENIAPTTGGGGVLIEDCPSGYLVNSLFYENLTQDDGAAVHVRGTSDIDIANCTITDNAMFWDPRGSGLFVAVGAHVDVRNSIIFGNYTTADIVAFGSLSVEYSTVPATFPGTGNIHGKPKFVNADLRNYELRLTSPCVDAGNNSAIPTGHTLDLDGNARFTDDPEVDDSLPGISAQVDMGCFERVPFVYGTRYVDIDAAPGGDGMTWATAYNQLTDALATTPNANISEIWVAEGTYFPDDGTGDRSATFRIEKGVRIFGGFDGTEQFLEERDWIAHKTILSGNIGSALINSDNSYHVVTMDGNDSNMVLNGFTVERGLANGVDVVDQRGAGLFVETGLINDQDNPAVRHCTFQDNVALLAGGAVFLEGRNTSFYNCRFIDNTSSTRGGAIRHGENEYDQPSETNVYGCEFIGNVAQRGGGVSAFTGSVNVANSTFFENFSTNEGGGGLFARSCDVEVTNSIFWLNSATIGNTQDHQVSVTGTLTVDESCLEGWNGILGGVGNFGANPRFIDPVGGIFTDPILRLCSDSPCIDSGMNAGVPGQLSIDLLGSNRIVDTNVDMGAYEHTGEDLVLTGPEVGLFPGTLLTLSTCGGMPLGNMLLAITGVDGAPLFAPLVINSFDLDGRSEFQAIVPAGLSGIELTFTSLGYTPAGNLGESNETTVKLN